ncbi:MAG: hypothetical protein PF961_11490 [Planctomycetota bacterium]|jgi:Rod binding domain-containing protein|nr:hypothetical protein [Planctomycetota bacterium]
MPGELNITRAGHVDQSDPHARLRKAAEGFEEFFIKQMLKHSRGGLFDTKQDGLFVSSAMTPFEQLQHDAIAENAAGGLGVAEMLIRHLTAKGALPPEEL